MTTLTLILDAIPENSDYISRAIAAGAAIVGGSGWVKLFVDKATMRQAIETLEKDAEKTEKDLRERILDISASKGAMRRKFEQQMDQIKQEIKEERENNKREFEKVNAHLMNIESLLGEIKGKLDK